MAAVSDEAKEKQRERNRLYAAARRAADPEGSREYARQDYARNRDKRIAKVRAWRANLDPEVARERARRIHLRQHYGMELEEFDALRAAQDHRCAICRTHEDALPRVRKGDHSSLFVDHDHDTGSVRGLLCQSCNLLVGHAREDARVLRAAIQYLAAHHERTTP